MAGFADPISTQIDLPPLAPVAIHVDTSISPEVKLVGKTLEGRFFVKLPKRPIGEKAMSVIRWTQNWAFMHRDDCGESARTESAKTQDERG